MAAPGALAAAVGRRPLVLPCAAILLVYVVVFAVPPLIQTLVDDEGMTNGEAGSLMTAFTVAYCLGGVPAGRLTDRFGAARVLLGGTLLAGVAALGCATTAALPVLVVLRLAVGAGTALVLTAGVLRVVETLPPLRQPTGIGWITVSAYLGTGLSYLLVPLLVGPLGWQGVIAATGVAAVVGGLAVGLGPARAAPRGRAAAEPSAPAREVLAERRFQLVAAMLFLDLAALFGLLTWLPPYMEKVLGLPDATRSTLGILLSLSAIPGALGSAVATRRGAPPARVAGASIALTAPIALLAVEGVGGPITIAILGALLVAGANAATLPLFVLAPGVVRPSAAGTAAGLATTIGLGGTAVATYAGGVLVDSVGYGAAFAAFGAAGALGAALALPLARALAAPAGAAEPPPPAG